MTIEFTPFGALAVMLLVMVIGEVITKATKGWFPSALVITLLLCAGFWTILPADLVARAGVSATLFQIISGLLVANLGTLIGRREMAAQWRTVLIALMGLASIIVICLTAGAALFGWSNAVAAAPPICGAAIATAMVRAAAEAAGNTQAALIAVVCMAVQCLVGYPLGAFCLNKETRRLSALYKRGELKAPASAGADGAAQGKKKMTSTNLTLLKLAVIVLISYYLQVLTKGYISMYVWCLILGFAAHETKVIETDALTKANSYGLAMTLLMLYLFGGLSASTPETIFPVFGIAISLVLMSAAAMAVMALIASKVFKQSFYMSYVIVLNAFFGFPINVMLTNEALDNNISDPTERAVVSSQIMPKMLIAGFTSVTIVSVFIAGILIKFL
ncbi:hypothetical protein [Feifania hominis]|uniref:Uncharacterized protein n=1 Tax=Feifania hominis TaxID=2763660 RepID=A0A926DD88_9FIRM|nr:hypothetical protein [Feifania hominis]MBC8535978.1 hypothetical protein [Feifania hominis]